MRCTPTCWARAIILSNSPAKSGKSRWQWLSVMRGGWIKGGLSSAKFSTQFLLSSVPYLRSANWGQGSLFCLGAHAGYTSSAAFLFFSLAVFLMAAFWAAFWAAFFAAFWAALAILVVEAPACLDGLSVSCDFPLVFIVSYGSCVKLCKLCYTPRLFSHGLQSDQKSAESRSQQPQMQTVNRRNTHSTQ